VRDKIVDFLQPGKINKAISDYVTELQSKAKIGKVQRKRRFSC